MANILLAMDSINTNYYIRINILNLSFEALRKLTPEELEIAVRKALENINKLDPKRLESLKNIKLYYLIETWSHPNFEKPLVVSAGTVLNLALFKELFLKQLPQNN
jgi:hypothetical protein